MLLGSISPDSIVYCKFYQIERYFDSSLPPNLELTPQIHDQYIWYAPDNLCFNDHTGNTLITNIRTYFNNEHMLDCLAAKTKYIVMPVSILGTQLRAPPPLNPSIPYHCHVLGVYRLPMMPKKMPASRTSVRLITVVFLLWDRKRLEKTDTFNPAVIVILMN